MYELCEHKREDVSDTTEPKKAVLKNEIASYIRYSAGLTGECMLQPVTRCSICPSYMHFPIVFNTIRMHLRIATDAVSSRLPLTAVALKDTIQARVFPNRVNRREGGEISP